MSFSAIREEWAVFAHDGEVHIGGVRRIQSNKMLVYIENFGEVLLNKEDVDWASDGKVVLRPDCLSREVLEAIAHAHDQETRRN